MLRQNCYCVFCHYMTFTLTDSKAMATNAQKKALIPFGVLAIVGAIAASGVLALIAVIFQDNITRFALNPRIPFQTYAPPAEPDYADPAAWALWPRSLTPGSADIFYIHSTTYASNRHWNAPIEDASAKEMLRRVAAPNEIGPFMRVGDVYGPFYRQATLFAEFTHKFDGLAARELAYRDISRAFEHFMATRQRDRPFFVVGHGQGALHGLGLLQHRIFDDVETSRQFVAAYLIGEAIPMSAFDNSKHSVTPCTALLESGCIVAFVPIEPGFDRERRRFQNRALKWDEGGALVSLSRPEIACVNPLDPSLGGEVAPMDSHRGAASATGIQIEKTPPAISMAVSAKCENGLLKVSRPRQTFLQRRHWFGAHWKPQSFNLFYHDLTYDAQQRLNAHKQDKSYHLEFMNTPNDKNDG